MKTILKALTLCLLALDVVASPLRVGTFNILTASRFRDTENAWAARQESVVDRIRDFDIVGLQEVRSDQREFLLKRLDGYEIVGECVQPGSTRFCFVPVVYRKARFTCEKSGTFWLSETPDKPDSKSWDSSEPRVCTYVVLKDRETGRRLAFANTHLDHRGVTAREKGAEVIADRLNDLAPVVVLVGDHNSNEIEGAAKTFLKSLSNALYLSEKTPEGSWRTFNDFVWRDTEVSTAEALAFAADYRNAYRGSLDGNRRNANANEKKKKAHPFFVRCGGNRIDFIYVTPGTRVLDYRTDNTPRGKSYPSDHFPVIATIDLETAAPIPSEPLRIAYNYCTLAYTMAGWGEKAWDSEIDRLAARGYNAALVMAGLPKVWQLVLRDYGLSDDDIRAFIPDEWAQPWWSMGNLEGEGGPLDDETIARDAALGRHIVSRLREKGIRPILQGFTGLLPSSAPKLARFKDVTFIPQGTWASYVRPTLMLPTDPAFAPAAEIWYRRLREVYGVTDVPYLAGDLFHEGGNAEVADVTKCVAAVQAAQQANCPGAIWFVQSWRQNPTPPVCAGLDPRFTVIEGLCGDMGHGSERDTGYGRLPWVWCEVGNFGGNHGLYGNLRTLARMGRAAKGLAANTFRGWGALSEGYFTNPVCQDLFDEMMARPVGSEMSDAELDRWLADWAAKRYGFSDKRIDAAWRRLKDSVYNCPRAQHGAVKNPMTLAPSWDLGDAYRNVAGFQNLRSDFYWKPHDVEMAARLFLEVAEEKVAEKDRGEATSGFLFDFANTVRQVLSDRAAMLVPELRDKIAARRRFLALIDLEDRLLACVPAFRLDTYEMEAGAKAGRRGERAFRRMITTWRDPAHKERSLNDYACREYAGLLGGYYRSRWSAFFGGRSTRPVEEAFVKYGVPTPPLPADPLAALVAIAREILPERDTAFNLVPYPQEVTKGEGVHIVSEIICNDVKRDATLPPEGYALEITPAGISVKAADDAGAFYARVTLKQLAKKTAKGYELPCCTIRDWPKFAWRGVLFDDCRHFFGKEAVKRTMDAMAAHKMNVFHWHLTDDQGWRLAVPKYPELARRGAVRTKMAYPDGLGKKGYDTSKYGPYFYTEADVKEVLAYAKARHIRVIPEIELPGHSVAAIAAYPDLCCRGKLEPREPYPKWGISKDILCAGNDDAIRFLEDVLDYVVGLFPDAVVHIGGDEAPKVRWEKCPKCQARMKAVGAKDAHALQGWMTQHFTEYLAKKGRRAIGWDEIMEAEIPADTLVMWWRGRKPDIVVRAAKEGHDVVVCPSSHYYFDHRQLPPAEHAKRGYGHPSRRKDDLTLEKAYTFDPLAVVPPEGRKKVIGIQCNMWSEHIVSPSEHEWKMWPRAAAVAETAWSGPNAHGWTDFKTRIDADMTRMAERGYNVCR